MTDKKLVIEDEHVLLSLYDMLVNSSDLDKDDELRVLFSDLCNLHAQIVSAKQGQITVLLQQIDKLNDEIDERRKKIITACEDIEFLKKEIEKWSHIS